LGASTLGQTDLTARVNASLLSNNAGVQKLTKALAQDQTRLSGIGKLQSALSTFQAVAQSLANGGLETAAATSNAKVLSGVTSGGAKAGSVNIEVRQLAQGQQLNSRSVSSSSAAIGSGAATTVKIDFGSTNGSSFAANATGSISLTIDSSNNSLKGIADALKAAGVDAAVVRADKGYSLAIRGESGSARSLRISVGGDAALQKLLAYNPSGVQNLSQSQAARDAQLTVDGKAVTSASNVVTGAIKGVALALNGVGSSKLTVSQDSGQISKNVGLFVSAFNHLNEALGALKQGELKGDSSATGVAQQLAQLVGGATGSALSAIGVSAGKDGALKVDSKALASAVAADPQAVAKLFINDGAGLADKFADKLGKLLGSGGLLQQQTSAIGRDISSLNTKKSNLTAALNAQASAQLNQYTQQSDSALPGLSTGGKSLFDFLA
jgi:flagellar hook-associated protein 2